MVNEVIKARASVIVGGVYLASTAPTFTLNDSSVVPTYSVGWYSDAAGTVPITSINEGNTLYLVLKTTSIYNGNQFTYSLTGTGLTAADFTTGGLTGAMTVNNNIASVQFVLKRDFSTEGVEDITATVKRGSGGVTVGTALLTINDTSKNPTYTAGFFTDNLANTPMSSVNEGGTTYIVLITTDVPDFTYLDWEITGAGITLDDSGASVMSGQAMVRTNTYWATIKPKLDVLTEGNETLTMTFKRDGVVVASASIVINDTSYITNTGYVFNSVVNNPAPAYDFKGINTATYSVNLGWGTVTVGPFGSVVTDDLYVGTTKLNISRVVNYYGSLGYEDYMGYVDIATTTNVPNINSAVVKMTNLSNGSVVFNKAASITSKSPLNLVVSGLQSTDFDIPTGVQLKVELTTT